MYVKTERMSGMLVKEFSLFDIDEETGEVSPVSDTKQFKGSPLGKGWFAMYDKAIDKLLESGAPPTAWKLYFKLVRMNNFKENEVRCQKTWLIKELGVTRNAFYNALKWLVDNHFVKETTSMGQGAFIVNPDFSARGTKSLEGRKALWTFSVKND